MKDEGGPVNEEGSVDVFAMYNLSNVPRVSPPQKVRPGRCNSQENAASKSFVARPTRALIAFTVALALPSAWAGVTDQEYQAWAEKVYDKTDTKGVQRGSAVSCVFCQIVVGAVAKQVKMNKQRPREDRFSEEQTEEVLIELCDNVAPRMAKSMNGYTKDSKMLCKRVVRENVGDMIDAASLGEDVSGFCKESKICPFSLQELTKGLEKMSEAEKEGRGEANTQGGSMTGVIDILKSWSGDASSNANHEDL